MSKDDRHKRSRGPRQVWIGYEPRQQVAYAVCQRSCRKGLAIPEDPAYKVLVKPIILEEVQRMGLYTREVTVDNVGRLYDPISEFNMSTEFAISRFLVAALAIREKFKRPPGESAKRKGWALFMDCDMLVRDRLDTLFEKCEANPDKAVFCVKHKHEPKPGVKMDDQLQLVYARKNWSSVMAINLDHPANAKLTLDLINRVPGRDLHRFCWLGTSDELIGELEPRWNHLVGWSSPDPNAAIVHYTEGGPWLAATQPEYKNLPFADEWLRYITDE